MTNSYPLFNFSVVGRRSSVVGFPSVAHHQQEKSYNLKSLELAWGVRPYQPGDEGQATELFEQAFERPMSIEHYRWKLLQSPWRQGLATAWYADTGSQLVGQYAGSAMPFKLGDETVRILHGCDVMTHPDFQGQGVLTAVGSAATEYWRGAGVPFLTGLHYGGWGSRRHFLGWREQFKAIWMWRPLHLSPLLRRRNTAGALALPLVVLGLMGNVGAYGFWRGLGRKVKVEGVTQPDETFDRLWERLSPHYEALVVRDRAWVNYRYAAAPDGGYRILLARRDGEPTGYLVYRFTAHDERPTGWIVDLFTAPKDRATRAALLRVALTDLFFLGAESARIFVGAGTPLARHLRWAGFMRAKGDYDISIVPLRDDMPHPALRDPNRWYTMAGDFDVL